MNWLDDDDRRVAENTEWVLYQNGMTEMYAKRLNDYDANGFTLRGEYTVVLAIRKSDGYRTYLMMDRNGRPFADWNGPEQFDIKLMMILADLKDSCDIVNMAEKRMF